MYYKILIGYIMPLYEQRDSNVKQGLDLGKLVPKAAKIEGIFS